tara:strand:+ start:1041 stop:1250 length:210 start_codon:yes stop_codon:yes gene_type:complete
MLRNIRHIQIKKIAYSPNLFKAIIIFEDNNSYDESDDIEYIKYLENQTTECPPCLEMEKKRRSIDKFER